MTASDDGRPPAALTAPEPLDPRWLGLEDKVAWVTGASRGLGRALAIGLAAAGAQVLLSARDEGALEDAADEIRRAGGSAHVIAGSVADEGDVGAAVERARALWGRLDVLINNAGISPVLKRAEQLERHEWQSIVDTNLSGAFECCTQAIELMGPGGSIVNVSSVHGVSGFQRMAAYAASKGGLEALTRTLAVEWAERGVRVNAIAPGYLETDMTTGMRDHPKWSRALLERVPLGRFGTTEDIVPAALFLTSPLAGYITGTTLFVDGGWTAQ